LRDSRSAASNGSKRSSGKVLIELFLEAASPAVPTLVQTATHARNIQRFEQTRRLRPEERKVSPTSDDFSPKSISAAARAQRWPRARALRGPRRPRAELDLDVRVVRAAGQGEETRAVRPGLRACTRRLAARRRWYAPPAAEHGGGLVLLVVRARVPARALARGAHAAADPARARARAALVGRVVHRGRLGRRRAAQPDREQDGELPARAAGELEGGAEARERGGGRVCEGATKGESDGVSGCGRVYPGEVDGAASAFSFVSRGGGLYYCKLFV
jgi:hypothetical protein